jgi:hypothetical protein
LAAAFFPGITQWNYGIIERDQMGCRDRWNGTAELSACFVSFNILLEALGSALTDLAFHKELCPGPTRRSSMSTKMNIMAALELHSACRRLMNG